MFKQNVMLMGLFGVLVTPFFMGAKDPANRATKAQGPAIEVLFIFMPGCPPCETMKRDVMPKFEEMVNGQSDCNITISQKNGTTPEVQKWLLNTYKQTVSRFPTLFLVIDGKVVAQLKSRNAQALWTEIMSYVE